MLQDEKSQIIEAVKDLLGEYEQSLQTMRLRSLRGPDKEQHKQHLAHACEMLGHAESKNFGKLRALIQDERPKEKWDYFKVPWQYPRSVLIQASLELEKYEEYDTEPAIQRRALLKEQLEQGMKEIEALSARRYSCDTAGIKEFIREIRSPLFKFMRFHMAHESCMDEDASLRRNFEEQGYIMEEESEEAFRKYVQKDPASVKHINNTVAALSNLKRYIDYEPAKVLMHELGELSRAWSAEFDIRPMTGFR
jgi:hypothetical protein